MVIQRTTQQSGIDRVSLDLTNNLRTLQEAQNRLTSGKQIGSVSDDPIGVGSATQLRSSIGRAGQYLRNVDDGLARLSEADRAMQQIAEHLTRMKDLAIQARSGASTPTDRQAIAVEMQQLREAVIAVANVKYLGAPVFGGTSGAAVAYDASGTYVGDDTTIERNVAPGVRVAINVNGSSVFSTGGTSLFTTMQSLIDGIVADPDAASVHATTLDSHLSTIQQGLAEVGGRMNRLDALKVHTDESIASMQEQLSSIEDVDLEQAILDVKLREVAYQASLSATARVIQPSLVDFLK
jgi:flagellar hook-associated protein 3 FlgL